MKTRSNTNHRSDKAVAKTQKAPVEPSVPGSGPIIVDGFLHFSPLDLARYELAQAKVLNALQSIGLKRSELETARRQFEDRSRAISAELEQIVAISRKNESELMGLQSELQTTYGLDFKQVAYDDVSGKITVLGSPVTEDDFKSNLATKE